jgi:hypothetical protein
MRKCVANAGASSEILNYVFNSFLNIFEEEQENVNEIQNKSYVEYLLYFIRLYKNKI